MNVYACMCVCVCVFRACVYLGEKILFMCELISSGLGISQPFQYSKLPYYFLKKLSMQLCMHHNKQTQGDYTQHFMQKKEDRKHVLNFLNIQSINMHLVYTLATYSCAVLSHGHGRMRAHACMHTHTFTHTHTHTLHLTLLTLASSSGSAIAILVSLFNFLLFFPPWICRPKV